MQTNWRKCSSRTIAHENALKRSLFVNYSSTVLMGAMQFWLQKSIRLLAALFTVPDWKSFAPAHALNLDGPFRSVVSPPLIKVYDYPERWRLKGNVATSS